MLIQSIWYNFRHEMILKFVIEDNLGVAVMSHLINEKILKMYTQLI